MDTWSIGGEMVSWDGEDRRKGLNSDHDNLIEVIQILKSHVANFDHHRQDFRNHIHEDETNFKRIDKTIYMATGVLSVVIYIINVWMK